ncbi:MAG: DUF4412 domain-containing protein [Planctomycetota bacterium]|jgi:hypothetical protein
MTEQRMYPLKGSKSRPYIAIIVAACFITAFPAVTDAGQQSKPQDGYMLRAKASGIFGMPKDRKVNAIFYLSPTKLRIDLASGESSSILDLDCKHLIETSHTQKEYIYHAFEKLPFKWDSRRQDLDRTAETIKAGIARGNITNKMGEEKARKCGLHVNSDGNIEVKFVPSIIKTGKTKTVAGYEASEVVVKENDIEVFRLWLTNEISRPFDIVKFYTAMGYLSPEMVEKLKELKGFPVESHMILHIKQKKLEVEMELSEFLPSKVYRWLFTVPKTYQRKKESLTTEDKCAYCGKPLGEERIQSTIDGLRYEFCGKKHFKELEKEIDASEFAGYRSLLRDLLQKHGFFKKIEKRLDKNLEKEGISREDVKNRLEE